jgi:alanyl-tRNA synthetase
MQLHELRKTYLEFFVRHGHRKVESAPLVPNDPTLLFTSAGMVQFKDIFWGRVDPPYRTATTCQKCFRTTDIENVGKTAFHHTFFEMLGNFSFGDYFKEGAIDLAWEFLTKELGIPVERLWVSVYEQDDEAYAIWRERIGIPPERIARLGKEHNWWGPVGDAGPCGPDSEIFFDHGPQHACGPECTGVACDCDRFSEIWNLVFTQYDAHEDGTLVPLSRRNIDTGMGLERTSAVLQGVQSDFEVDAFRPIVEAIDSACAQRPSDERLVYRNTIADHIRAIAFLIAEGVMPSNEKQGYVLRRILRRAVFAGERLGLEKGALATFVDPVLDAFGSAYPEIVSARELTRRTIDQEETSFLRTLRDGKRRLERILEELRVAGETVLPGEQVFEMMDTYGFPVEMTGSTASDFGMTLDLKGFEAALAEQRERSRAVQDAAALEDEVAIDVEGATRFSGYERLEEEATLITVVPGQGDEARLVFETSPFYAQSGGQVGDAGRVENLNRPGRAEVIDVRKDPAGVFLHQVRIVDGEFLPGDRCRLVVDAARRRRIAANHTATHLLHAALRRVLGEHVIQAGSFVSGEELRFDFAHFARMRTEEITRVEDLVNEAIRGDLAVTTRELPLDEAKASGAIAHFEEEYRGKDRVRVVSVDEFSRELCGGTHVNRTGEIGAFVIRSEESIASGTRRIRAVTGQAVLEVFREQSELLERLRDELGEDPLAGVERLRAELADLNARLDAAGQAAVGDEVEGLLARAETIGGVRLVAGRAALDGDGLKQLADRVEESARPAVVVLGSEVDGRGLVVCKISPAVKGIDAGAIIRTLAGKLGGGGGGNRAFAQGGGPDATQLDAALKEGVQTLRDQLHP